MTQQVSTRAEMAGQRPSPLGPQPGTRWAAPGACRVGDVPALSAFVNTVSLARQTRPQPRKMGGFPDTTFHGGTQQRRDSSPRGTDVPMRPQPRRLEALAWACSHTLQAGERRLHLTERGQGLPHHGVCVPGMAALCPRGAWGPGSAFTPSQHLPPDLPSLVVGSCLPALP